AQAINGPCGVLAIQNEGIGQQALDRTRINVSLVRHVAAAPDPAPIAHQKMRILVLHTIQSLLRNGTDRLFAGIRSRSRASTPGNLETASRARKGPWSSAKEIYPQLSPPKSVRSRDERATCPKSARLP